jgi:two-component system, OmpR family, aerobic respiration control sensor histidine kinase ArcB
MNMSSKKNDLEYLKDLTLKITGDSFHKDSIQEYVDNIVNYFTNIIYSMPNNVYWLDRQCILRGGNNNLAHLLNLKSGADLEGLSYEEMAQAAHLPTKAMESFRTTELEVMATGIPSIDKEEPAITVDGKTFYYLSNKTPLRNKKGKIIGIVGISTNITTLKETQKALTLALEKAEVADQAKTEFLENMRHDIRTPLTGIIGSAQLLQLEKNNPAKIGEYTKDLVDSSNALLDFLNRILESIKFATGEIPLIKMKFDFRKELESIIKLNQSLAAAKNLVLQFTYDENIPTYLVGDPVRLQRIVLELITNALTFTQKGEVTVTVKLKQQELQRVIVEIVVHDTGVGIPADKQLDIYTRFKRLTPAYQGIYPGAGLGLTMVKQFLEEMDGEISLKSQVNKGSTFTCFIPFLKPLTSDDSGVSDTPIPAKKGKVLQLVLPTSDNSHTQKSRILVVEDQAVAAKMVQQILSQLQCQVDIAVNGMSALERIREEDYDLILMDMGLPDLDGIEVTRRIRLEQWKRNPSIPIIGLTAHIDAESKRRCLAAGMDAIFAKPLNLEKAAEILNAFIPTYQQGASTQEVTTQEESEKPEGPAAVLDVARAKEVLGTEKLLKEVLGLLLKGLNEDMEQLKHYHGEQNWQGIRALAHKWRGGALYCGAVRLQQACSQLEDALREMGSFTGAEVIYQHLLQVAEETKVAARQYLNQ